jgi:hemerythrin superfamily protein
MTQTTIATELLREQHLNVKQMFSRFVPASSDQERQELFDCLRSTLAVHETAEEIVVYPMLRSTGGEGIQVAEARIAEESEAKSVLADLEKLGVNGQGFDDLFEKFRTSVLAHAEAEESTVFPLLEREIDADKLQQMAEAIQVAERIAPTHPHPHGPDSAVGNLVVGPFVAIVDRVRDALQQHRKAG